jgi:hypothetical protein
MHYDDASGAGCSGVSPTVALCPPCIKQLKLVEGLIQVVSQAWGSYWRLHSVKHTDLRNWVAVADQAHEPKAPWWQARFCLALTLSLFHSSICLCSCPGPLTACNTCPG